MLKKIVLLYLICCSAGAAYAYDIKNALADAYHNNDNLKAERMRYKQKMVEADRGKYRLMPDVSLSAVSSYTDYMDYNEKTNSINFNAGYTIPLGGGKFHELKASGVSQELASARLAQAEAATLLSAAKAYIRYIMALDAEKISKDTLNLMSIYFDAAKQKAEVGSLSKIDMAKARQQLASANADAVKARSQLCEAEASFLHVIGIEPQANSNSFEEPDPITAIPAVYQEALDVANQNNILLRVAKADEQLAHYELRAAQSALLPTLNLAFTLRQNIDSYFEPADSKSAPLIKTSSFMASLNVPIFQEGMSGYARVKQARLNASRAFYSHKEAISDMKEQVKVAIENVAINKAFIDAATEAVDAATVNRDAIKEAYEAQAAIESDALKAERDLVAEQLKLLDAKTRYLLSAYELLSSCGLLTFEYLQIE